MAITLSTMCHFSTRWTLTFPAHEHGPSDEFAPLPSGNKITWEELTAALSQAPYASQGLISAWEQVEVTGGDAA